MSDEFGTYEMREVRRVVNLTVKITGMDKHDANVRSQLSELRQIMMLYFTVVAGIKIARSIIHIITSAGTSAPKDILTIGQTAITAYLAETNMNTMNEVS